MKLCASVILITFFSIKGFSADVVTQKPAVESPTQPKKKSTKKTTVQAIEPPAKPLIGPAPETFHENVSRRVTDLATRIDSFFGDSRALDARNKSSAVVSLSQDIPEGGIPTPNFGVALNLKLTNLERAGKELENSVLGNGFEKINPTEEEVPKGPQITEDIRPWRLVLDQQLGAKWLPTYSAKLRASKDFDTGEFLQHFSVNYGWDTENIWNSRIILETDYALNSNWLFRWTNEGHWYFSRVLITTSHGPSFFHTINDYTSMSYNFRYDTEYIDNTLFYASGYSASVTFRRDLFKKWIFLDLVPSINFPRKKDFARVLNFGIRIECIFGDL